MTEERNRNLARPDRQAVEIKTGGSRTVEPKSKEKDKKSKIGGKK